MRVIEFRLLGNVEVVADGHAVTIGYAQLRSVLATLLIDANRPVSVDQLVDRVWGTRRLPRRPRGAVQHSVTLLRKALAGVPGVSIGLSAGGYRITAEPDAIDVCRFHELLRRARASSGDRQSLGLFEQALGLWRGVPLAGLSTPWIDAFRATLVREHQSAQLDIVDIRLRLGHHAALLSELSERVADDPLDERAAGQYLVALYRNGRQAAALRHYDQVRRRLADELGADPGPTLRRVHQQILTADPALAAPGPHRVVPRQLPANPGLFAGRERELAALTAALDGHGEDGAVAITTIGGTGGIGKTWLALRWAHGHAHRFPDGQLHVNLRGFDPSAQPVPADRVVRWFLEALGVAPDCVPADLDAQAALYRSQLAGRRMLVLLDNARDIAQVVPLLPGSPTCCVLVTSRHRLTGLVTTHGARHLDLDVLPDQEARALLLRRMGEDRVRAEPGAVDDLVRRCAGLPLALGIVATRAATHPQLPISVLAADLRDHGRRLDALNGGDPATNLRVVLSSSHHALPPDAARTVEALGLVTGPDIGLAAAASLTGLPVPRVAELLHILDAAHLVQRHPPDRYRMHDLVRLYATERSRGWPDPERTAAQRRLVDFYLHTAYRSALVMDPQSPPLSLTDPPPGCHPECPPDAATATAWFATEHRNLLASQLIAMDNGWHAQVWQQAWALNFFHLWRGLLHDALVMWQPGLTAADHLADPIAQIKAHRSLGTIHTKIGRYADARSHYHHALEISERAGDLRELALTHINVASAWYEDDADRALHHATAALDLFRTLDDPHWVVAALNHLGWCYARLARYDTARAHCENALALFRQHADPVGEAAALDGLGYIAHHTNQHAAALHHYRSALTLHQNLGYTSREANTLEQIGHTHHALGQHRHAHAAWHQAFDLYQAQHRTTDADRLRQRLSGPQPGRPEHSEPGLTDPDDHGVGQDVYQRGAVIAQ